MSTRGDPLEIYMSMKDLRARGAEALQRMTAERSAEPTAQSTSHSTTASGAASGAQPAESGGPAAGAAPTQPALRAISAPGARALLQPELDRLSQQAQQAQEQAQAAQQALAQAVQQQRDNPVELELDRIVEVGGRRRRLSPEEFAELRSNLEANELVHPVVVRLLPESVDAQGRPLYELISGYNRLDVFRLLGRRTIAVRVMAVTDERVSGAAFWSNLLQPSLPDYEKFLGLSQHKAQHGLTDSELARRAGISKTLVSFLMSFAHLPAPAHEILESSPRLLGATLARRLAKVAQSGHAEAVVQALALLSAGEATQEEAVRGAEQQALQPNAVSSTASSSGRKVLASTVQIRSGALDLCRMVSKGTSLRLEFKIDEHRERAQEIVTLAMEDLAAKLAGMDAV